MKGKFCVTSVGEDGINTQVEFSGNGGEGIAFYSVTVQSALKALRTFIAKNGMHGEGGKIIFSAAVCAAFEVKDNDTEAIDAVDSLARKLFDKFDKKDDEEDDAEDSDCKILRFEKPTDWS